MPPPRRVGAPIDGVSHVWQLSAEQGFNVTAAVYNVKDQHVVIFNSIDNDIIAH